MAMDKEYRQAVVAVLQGLQEIEELMVDIRDRYKVVAQELLAQGVLDEELDAIETSSISSREGLPREHLFKGKTLAGNRWVYGYLYRTPQESSMLKTAVEARAIRTYIIDIYTNEHVRVLAGTVGEYSGFNDTDGKWIFEGDIVEGQSTGRYTVKYASGQWELLNRDEKWWLPLNSQDRLNELGFRVLGNEHDRDDREGEKNGNR